MRHWKPTAGDMNRMAICGKRIPDRGNSKLDVFPEEDEGVLGDQRKDLVEGKGRDREIQLSISKINIDLKSLHNMSKETFLCTSTNSFYPPSQQR